jgi:enoyl-CoA hydratase/carnithine racemase
MNRITDTAFQTLRLELADDGILIVQLHRPEQLNAFTVTMANELIALYEGVNADDRVRALVVTGAGRAFCAGMDLSAEGNVFGLDETLRPTPADLRERYDEPAIVNGVRDTGGRVNLALFRCTKPVIGAINGAAVGIGATMTLPMDVRLASTGARFGFVFGKLGIVPEACSSWFLPRLVGMPQALKWTLSAQIFDAAEAERGGLVQQVCAPEDLLPAAQALARSFVAGRSPVAVALTRQMMWRNSAFAGPEDAHRVDSLAMFYTSIGDGKEGVAAFREKRAPEFRGSASTALPQVFPPEAR